MKKQMSLAAAFRYRKKLLKIINKMTNNVYTGPITADEFEMDRCNEHYETKNFDTDVELLTRLMGLYEIVSSAIDRANNGARELINTINRCNDVDKMLTTVRDRVLNVSLVRVTSFCTIQLQPLYEKTWADEIKQNKTLLNETEERLSSYNAKNTVSFDVDDLLDKLVAAA